ncbi:hypothetical protein [Streptomyces sp. URMC 123]|uniref:hypothetical protein n=1 Tax=Streptomyces sp. URMC 123 TaxID=3423403 RepID=UPI003F19928E
MTAAFHDLAGEPRVAEDPIAQSEIAALTRRFEQGQEKTDREFGIVKSDLTALRLQVGNLDQKVDGLEQKIGEISEKIDRNQAQILEMLAGLIGKNAG